MEFVSDVAQWASSLHYISADWGMGVICPASLYVFCGLGVQGIELAPTSHVAFIRRPPVFSRMVG